MLSNTFLGLSPTTGAIPKRPQPRTFGFTNSVMNQGAIDAWDAKYGKGQAGAAAPAVPSFGEQPYFTKPHDASVDLDATLPRVGGAGNPFSGMPPSGSTPAWLSSFNSLGLGQGGNAPPAPPMGQPGMGKPAMPGPQQARLGPPLKAAPFSAI